MACTGWEIRGLFAGVGIDAKHDGGTNAKGIAATTELLRSRLRPDLREPRWRPTRSTATADAEGFHDAEQIDAAVGDWLELLRDDDLLVLMADHGVDPDAPHAVHTRSTRPSWPSSPDMAAGATTARSPTWARACCAGSQGREAGALPGDPFL